MTFFACPVISHEPWGLSGRRLVIPWDRPFAPGQWVQVTLPGVEGPRMYSIANSPGQGQISLLYTLVEEGQLTPRLALLQPGDRVSVAGPGGAFEAQKGANLWIAGGTGIAPFLSMQRLLEARWFGASAVPHLLQSSRNAADLFGTEVFRDLQAKGLLSYRSFVTQGPGSGLRVTSWLQSQDPEFFRTFDRIMMCGSTSMILDLRDILLDRGVDFHRIVSEVYF